MNGFENAMDQVNSALRELADHISWEVRYDTEMHACVHSLVFPVLHEIGLPMNVVILLNWACDC